MNVYVVIVIVINMNIIILVIVIFEVLFDGFFCIGKCSRYYFNLIFLVGIYVNLIRYGF